VKLPASTAIVAALLLATPAARATSFRYPLGGCASGCATVSAYFDLDPGSGVRDWNCGSVTYDRHRGTDFAIYGGFSAQDAGRNVVAAAAGDVIISHDGEFDRCTSGDCAGGGGFGNYVAIRHADGKVTYYGHMRRGSVRVGVGARVTCGQVIGLVGSSGHSTGPHCHFEVRVGGTADDPFAARSGCGGGLSYWVSQGGYRALPAETCEPSSTPTMDAGSPARDAQVAMDTGSSARDAQVAMDTGSSARDAQVAMDTGTQDGGRPAPVRDAGNDGGEHAGPITGGCGCRTRPLEGRTGLASMATIAALALAWKRRRRARAQAASRW
jgi:murein DD-endopeptidase MepM/ murein hydrolase activator NlpD